MGSAAVSAAVNMDVREEAACLPTERLEAEITRLAGQLAAAECRWLLLVAEFDRREAWRTWGCSSTVHWLGWQCGLDARAARERVRVARALVGFSLIREEFAAGRLSYSKVRAITRVATPATERDLAEMARHATAAQIERVVAGYRRAFDPERQDAADATHSHRSLEGWFDDDAWDARVRLNPEEGRHVHGVLDALVDRSLRLRPLAPGETRAQRRADALVEMATLAAQAIDHDDGEPLPRGDRYLAVVNVDHSVLTHGEGERCEVDGGPGLPAETARRISCDAQIVALVRGVGSAVVDIGQRTRAIPRWLRRQLHARDGGCRFPGCAERRLVDGHHVRHWAHGGETALSNLVELCAYHHRLVHEGGWRLHLNRDGAATFTRPDGAAFADSEPSRTPGGSAKPLPTVDLVEDVNARNGIRITPDTIIPTWHGERLDLDLALTALSPENVANRARVRERFRGTARHRSPNVRRCP